MFIVTVIPIARGIGKETLSYFSAAKISPGSVVEVPVRNRTVPALAIACESADSKKAELKSSSFALKKLESASAVHVFQPAFIEAASQAADYFAGSTGSVLATITSKTILENAAKIISIDNPDIAKPDFAEAMSVKPEPSALQADEEERLAYYKSLIREQFARKKSVFFCLPTIQDTKRLYEMLPKGIEQYTYVINSSLSIKGLVTTWNKASSEPHPVLIIATGAFLGLPRTDFGTIVIERESSSGYKSQTRPYVDIRTFAELYANKIGAKLVFGDLLLRVETLWRTKNGEVAELASLKFRSTSTALDVLVDMKRYKMLETPEFRIFSDELEDLIKYNRDKNEHLFIYASRRGLSPLTMCGDCGTTVLCSRCSAPVVLHQNAEGNFFLCHRCGERRSAEERCRVCGSWRLTTLGIGIELIEESLTNMFPDMKLFRMDKDVIKTHKQATSVAASFYNSPGSVLVGTEMALAYLEKPIDNTAVASIDSLFSIPDFRINEKIMNILLRMRSASQKIFLIQTRSRDQHLFDYATKGNLMDFYREEIEGRKKLGYPPFSTLIKVTARGVREKVLQDIEYVKEYLHEYKPLVFPAFIETVNKKTIMHALIKLEPKKWIKKSLLEKFRALPPHISINIDPESLL
jgi:primosomal protein N' (replication factor Y)